MKIGWTVRTWQGTYGVVEYVRGGWVGVRERGGRLDEWQESQLTRV